MQHAASGKKPDGGGSNVIPFVQRATLAARLSWRDRMDIEEWAERARRLGYDRLVIHERGRFDPPDIDSFLSIYRIGTHWARWSLARRDGFVVAWCSGTGADVGRFGSVSDALGALLTAQEGASAAQ